MTRAMPSRPAIAALLATALAACAHQAGPTAPEAETYRALGQEPGWSLQIANGRIDYVGDYGEMRIGVARPDPRPTFNGRRYETPRLVVDITYSRCNDAMSGHGYEHQVTVIVEGRAAGPVHGCGGTRRTDWDQ